MFSDSLFAILNLKETSRYLRVSALLVTAVVLMSSCESSTGFYENRVQADDVVCPPGMSAYRLPGVLPQAPRNVRDTVCMSDDRMRQTAGQQAKKPERTVVAQPSSGPPAGAITADVGLPPLGTRWRSRFINAKGVTSTNLVTVVDDETREGTTVHRRNYGTSADLYDKATANLIAILRNGKESESHTPHTGTFDWPLYVGKSWKARYVYRDLVRQTTIDPVQYDYRVEAYEKVVIPAGTWDAFRITSENVNGTSLSTIWYAPELKLIVKRINETTITHSSGITKTVYEISEYPVKKETQ